MEVRREKAAILNGCPVCVAWFVYNNSAGLLDDAEATARLNMWFGTRP